MQCATHPDVETELACGRCGKAICPRCLVQTPVGARCRQCAHLRRIPTYNIAPQTYARGGAATLVAGVAAGLLWRLVIPFTFGFFFGIFVGLALGYIVGETVSWATNRKRGAPLQALAGAGVVLAYFVRNALVGVALLPLGDVFGYVVVGVAIAAAIGRLR